MMALLQSSFSPRGDRCIIILPGASRLTVDDREHLSKREIKMLPHPEVPTQWASKGLMQLNSNYATVPQGEKVNLHLGLTS